MLGGYPRRINCHQRTGSARSREYRKPYAESSPEKGDISHLYPPSRSPILVAMNSTPSTAAIPASSRPVVAAPDDITTLGAISIIATMLATMLHEGLGHAAVAIATLHASGTLTTVAWSSDYDSKLVLAGGTLVNLGSAFVCWLLLRAARNAAVSLRFFLFITMAFNLFTGTGYFLFSGVSNFGDWAGKSFRACIPIGCGASASSFSEWPPTGAQCGSSEPIWCNSLACPRKDRARFRRLTWVPVCRARH